MKTRTNTMSSGPCRQVLDCGSPPLPLPTSLGGLSANPNGIETSSPGLRACELPWVRTPERFNPNGVVAFRPAHGHNPVGVGHRMAGFPRVARASQPWALGQNPFGIHRITPGLVGNGKRGLARGSRAGQQAAFTRLDLVAVLLVLSLCAAVMLPALASNRPRSQRVLCASNLRQIGQAFNLWGSDHGDRLPYNVALTDGGTLRHPLAVNPWLHFSWMSNELSSPAILLCPSDTGRPARDFSADPNGGYLHPNFANAATSYALTHGEDGAGRTIISFDRNLGYDGPNACSVFAQAWLLNVFSSPPSPTLRWDDRLHVASGNILRLEGHVDQVSNAGLFGAFRIPADDNNGLKHFIKPR